MRYLASVLLLLVSLLLEATDFSNDLKELDTLLRTGVHKEVLKRADLIIQKAKKENNWNVQGRALIYSAQASHSLGEGQKMRDFLQKAIAIFKAHNDSAGLARSYWVDSFYFLKNNDAEEMYRLLEIARGFAEKSKDVEVQTRILLGLGLANWNLGRFSEAIIRLNEAAKLATRDNNAHLLALAYENLAVNYSSRADFPQAIENFRKALSIFEKEKNPHAVAYVYGNMGVTYERMGDIETAMTLFEKSLEIHDKSGYRFGQGIQTDNIAEAHRNLGHYDQAIEYSLKALEKVRNEGAWIRIQFLENLADRFLSMDNIEQAEFYAGKAQKELTDQENNRLLLQNKILMGRLELQRKAASASLRWLNEAASLAESMGDYYKLGICEGLKANAYEQLKQPAEASAAYLKAISLHEKIYSHESIHNWYAGLAELQARTGDHASARSNFDKSLSAIAAAADFISMDRFRVDLFRETSRIYHSYASYLAMQGKHQEALRILEEGRARDLRLRIAQARGMKNMSQEQADLLGQIHSLQSQISKGDLKSTSLANLYTRLQKSSLEYKRLRNPNAKSFQNKNYKTPDISNSLYVEYAIHENSLLVFSQLNGNTQFRTLENAEKIKDVANAYVTSLSKPTKPPDRSQARELFKKLLEPELKNLENVDVIIIPDGFLHHLPFGALVDSKDSFLAEHYSITYAPSINLLAGLQRPDNASAIRVLSVANTNFSGIQGIKLPTLPLAPKEASEVAKYGRNSQIVIDQSEKQIKDINFSDFGIIHFATHTLIDEERPQRSSIVIKPAPGEDGLFRADEIYALKIPSSMVTLSSCRSGSGLAVPGEGLLGLSHAFFAAGARSLVMTYWNVSDKNASEFSDRFYGNLRGNTIAEALQQTQIEMIRSKNWNHPAYWAAFFVAGDSSQELQVVRPWKQLFPLIAGIGFIFLLMILFRFKVRANSSRLRLNQ